MPKPRPCAWRHVIPCQFNDEPKETTEIDGKLLCLLHWPLSFHTAESKVRAAQEIQRRLNEVLSNFANFDGVTFPRATYRCRRYSTLSFQHSTFEDHCSFDLIYDDPKSIVRFNNSHSVGLLSVLSRNVEMFEFQTCRFDGQLTVAIRSEHYDLRELDFSKSIFAGGLALAYTKTPIRLSFSGCEFHKAPDFSDVGAFPDRTFFHAKFEPTAITPEDEGRYRHIRNLFNANRAREEEGTFYVYEKRCHRKSLNWEEPRNWLPRILSKAYDISSRYGLSYWLALMWFGIVQLAAAAIYSLSAGRFYPGGSWDTKILAFTLAQVVKPFELFGSRLTAGGAYSFLGRDVGFGWLIGTAAHSVASLALLALFLLALRWRFRRE